MKLRKTNESITRSYDAEGNSQERVDNVSFEVLDGDNNSIGNAYVNTGNATLNINVYGFSTMEAGIAKLKEAAGIADEPED